MSSFTQGGGLYLNVTGYRESLFVQDNWKATSALTAELPVCGGILSSPTPTVKVESLVLFRERSRSASRWPGGHAVRRNASRSRMPGLRPFITIRKTLDLAWALPIGSRRWQHQYSRRSRLLLRGSEHGCLRGCRRRSRAPIINTSVQSGVPAGDSADPYGSSGTTNLFPAAVWS